VLGGNNDMLNGNNFPDVIALMRGKFYYSEPHYMNTSSRTEEVNETTQVV
jgi:hypothetical protein